MNTTTPIVTYMSKVYRWVLLLITSACACAGITFSVLKMMGFYQEVSWVALFIFVVSCLVYVGVGNLLISRCMKDGKWDPRMLSYGKIYLAIILLIQFNFILYLVPSKDFWAFAFFFVILSSFFLDYKFVLISIGEIGISLLISWFVNGAVRLPVRDEFFIPELVLRIICIILSFLAIYLITLFTGKFLANAKSNEPEENTSEMNRTLDVISDIAESLEMVSANASKLVSDTTDSLNSISKIAADEPDGASEAAHYMAENAIQLAERGKELADTVSAIRNLTSLLKESVRPGPQNDT